MSENKSRRRFLKVGSSMVLVTSAFPSAAEVMFKRSSAASKELIEVGIIMGWAATLIRYGVDYLIHLMDRCVVQGWFSQKY